MADPILTEKDIARFWSQTRINPGRAWGGTPCVEWTGTPSRPGGYGKFVVAGETLLAHRVAWLLGGGTWPRDRHVLHHCDNPPCVEKSHLFTGDQASNMRDMYDKGRSASQRKTHCPAGHEYSAENTYRYKNRRECRVCRRQRLTLWASENPGRHARAKRAWAARARAARKNLL